MAPTLYTNLFDGSKEKKPRSEKQQASFEKARLALAAKRKNKSKPEAKVEASPDLPVLDDSKEPPVEKQVKSTPTPNLSESEKIPEWFKNVIRQAREDKLLRSKAEPPKQSVKPPEQTTPPPAPEVKIEVAPYKAPFIENPTYMTARRNLFKTMFPGRTNI